MKGTCPITGEAAEIEEFADRVSVAHPTLGHYNIDIDALPTLADGTKIRDHLARWMSQVISSGARVPPLTAEFVHLFERISDLDGRISEWHELHPLMGDDDSDELWKKIKLEWSYNSNHIEGNTLTYNEAELLLIHGRTGGAHPLRDYEEMKAHSVAIEHLYSLAGRKQPLAEIDIRNFNKIILKEPFWKSAEAPDGRPTRKHIVPGEYKTQPNHVRTPTGELHRFAAPEDTPALMKEWLDKFRTNLENSTYPIPLFLAESHWAFLQIHPFDDGNGRTARLLTNYALLWHDILPIVIKAAERDRYIGGLQNADTGKILPLAEFMLENISWSLELGLRAVRGESIWETEDIDKEIAIFVRERRGEEPANSDVEAVDNVVATHVRPTVDALRNKLDQLSQLFRTYSTSSYLDIGGSRLSMQRLFEPRNWEPRREEQIVIPGFRLTDDRPVILGAEFRFIGYSGNGSGSFNLTLAVTWTLRAAGFSLRATIDGNSVCDLAANRTLYSQVSAPDSGVVDKVKEICGAAMAEIDRRTQDSS